MSPAKTEVKQGKFVQFISKIFLSNTSPPPHTQTPVAAVSVHSKAVTLYLLEFIVAPMVCGGFLLSLGLKIKLALRL